MCVNVCSVVAGELTWTEFVSMPVVQKLGNKNNMEQAKNRVNTTPGSCLG